jgi:hypothetical protein
MASNYFKLRASTSDLARDAYIIHHYSMLILFVIYLFIAGNGKRLFIAGNGKRLHYSVKGLITNLIMI